MGEWETRGGEKRWGGGGSTKWMSGKEQEKRDRWGKKSKHYESNYTHRSIINLKFRKTCTFDWQKKKKKIRYQTFNFIFL